MKKNKLSLQWAGSFIELCIGRINLPRNGQIDANFTAVGNDIQSSWYDNTALLNALFGVDNWWSVDDIDHAMGLVFSDRSMLEAELAKMTFEIDGAPATVDPEALQLSFYAPEPINSLGKDERIVCHGTRQDAMLHLDVNFVPPFDPSQITLSFLHYPDYGFILIDFDYDGHDDVRFSFGETTHLQPRLFGKDHFNDASR